MFNCSTKLIYRLRTNKSSLLNEKKATGGVEIFFAFEYDDSSFLTSQILYASVLADFSDTKNLHRNFWPRTNFLQTSNEV